MSKKHVLNFTNVVLLCVAKPKLIQAEVVAIFRLRTKDAISLKCLEQEAGQWRNICTKPWQY